MQKIGTKRILGALLAAVMVLGNVPMAAFAAEVETVPAETAAAETTEPDETVAETIEPAETVPADIAAEETEPAETMPAVEIAVESDVMLTADEGISSGTPDGTPPVLNSMALSATTVASGGSIEIIGDASDDVSGVNIVIINFYCEENDKYLFGGMTGTYFDEGSKQKVAYPDGKLHGTLEIDQYVEAGTFEIESIIIRDEANNSATYFRYYNDDAHYGGTVAYPLPEFAKNLKIEVIESDTPDGTPPVLNSISLSSSMVTAPETVEVIVDACDDVSGIDDASISFYCKATDKILFCKLDDTYYDEATKKEEAYPDGKLHGTLEIDQYVKTGSFEIQDIEINDNAGNHVHYDRDYSDNIHYGGIVSYPLPIFAEHLNIIVIESDSPDAIPPVLNSISLSVAKVTAPGTIEVIVGASDNVSGIDDASISFYCKATDKTLACSLRNTYYDEAVKKEETYPDGKLHGMLEIDQYVETGTFEIQDIYINDNAGNLVFYDRDYRDNIHYVGTVYYPLPDFAKFLSFHVFNTIPDVTTSVAKPGFIDEVKNAEDNAYIVADYSGDATLTEDAFNAIAGTDKTLDLASDGITWRFNGNDITEEIKPIDLNVQITQVENEGSASGEAIADQLSENPGVVMKFAENGVLPGKATIQVKVDYAMREYLGSDQNLCVYYYNNETGKLELVAEDLKVINDTYVEFSITHCSYYVLTQKLPEEHPYSLGDVNHDGKINAKDSTLILQYSVGVLKDTANFCETCANVNGDSKLNAKDATMILQYSVGLRTYF